MSVAVVAFIFCSFVESTNAKETAKTDTSRRVSYFKEGCAFARSGKWKEAINAFLEGGIYQPVSAYEWRKSIVNVATSRPFDPNAHAAIGLAYRVPSHYSIEGKSNGDLSNYDISSLELKQALSLSEPGYNAIALTYLADGVAFHKQNKEKYEARRNIFEEILFCRWHPNLEERFNLAWLTGEGNLYIPSTNSTFNGNAVAAFSSAREDFPELDWDAKFLFASERNSKLVQRVDHGCAARIAHFPAPVSVSVDADRQIAMSYVNKYWTPQRIKSYCKPATVRPYFMRREYLPTASKVTGKFVLLPERIQVCWNAYLYQGKALFFTIWAERGKEFWILQNDEPYSIDRSDDSFLLHRFSDEVFLSIEKFEMSKPDESISSEHSNRRKSQKSDEKLVRNSEQELVGYTCNLVDGKRLNASLNRNGEIDSISVDGALDEIWTKAVVQVEQSNELVFRFDATGSLLKPPKHKMKRVH